MRQFAKHPVIRLPLTTEDIVAEVLAAVGFVTAIAVFATMWAGLPAKVPVHFGPSGAPDGWGSKSMLLPMPAIIVFLYGMLTLIARLPHLMNFPVPVTEENAPRLYRAGRAFITWIKVVIMWLFAYMIITISQVTVGQAHGLGKWYLPVYLVVVFGVLIMGIVRMIRAR